MDRVSIINGINIVQLAELTKASESDRVDNAIINFYRLKRGDLKVEMLGRDLLSNIYKIINFLLGIDMIFKVIVCYNELHE